MTEKNTTEVIEVILKTIDLHNLMFEKMTDTIVNLRDEIKGLKKGKSIVVVKPPKRSCN
jgi:hypothetical protein